MGRKKPRDLQIPWGGDHGTGTAAATAGTEVQPIEGENPNRMARRLRINQIERMKPHLSQRQYQAAQAIQEAYCLVEMLSSGSALKEQVDTSARPDATIDIQVDARSRLVYVMKAVPRDARPIVEHVCWHNQPISAVTTSAHKRKVLSDTLKAALDLVAGHLRY